MPAIAVHHTATSDKSWDGPAAKANLKNDGDRAYYRKAYAWEDSKGDGTTKSEFKFIHHEVSSDGSIGAANLEACSSGIAVLNGGRGGADIPEGDRAGVHDHLAAHLKDAGKEAPPLKESSPAPRPRVAHDLRHVWNAVCSSPWAIMPEKLAMIVEVVRMRALGERDPETEQSLLMKAASRPGSQRAGAVAVLPLYGVVAQRMDMMSASSGGCSTEQFAQMLRAAMADPSVSAVVIDIDSPGGSVYGVPELADEIYAARKQKPIGAISNSLSASAAYWIGSAASEFSCTPSGEVGSIGVFCEHFDESRAVDMMGVTPTLISAGKYKTEGNPYAPLNGQAMAAIQKRVDDYYGMFVKGVARGRGVSQASVRDGFGEGRVVGAGDALKMGMIDRVETLEQMVTRLGGGKLQTSANARASFENEIEIAQARRIRRAAI